MGTVLAKEIDSSRRGPTGFTSKEVPFGSGQHPCETNRKAETKTVDLQGISARVDRINVEGVVRTKDDIIQSSIKELFKATNFEEVISKAHFVRGKLQRLGCFRNIAIHIDTSSGPNATANGYEVTYQVQELKKVSGGVSTQISNNEGLLVINMGLPNLWGRGESLTGMFSHGSRRTKTLNLSLKKPFISKWDVLGSIDAFQRDEEFPMSGYKVIDRGLLLDLGFSVAPRVKNQIQYEACWREIGVGNRYAAFEVREDAGNTLKSAIRHLITVDRRDSVIFPSCGSLCRLVTEFSGIGGNVGFLKNELNLQGNWSFWNKDLILQLSLNGGIMNFVNEEKPAVCDNFFLGGPTTLRGFEYRGIGPQSDGCFTGGTSYWSTGMHIFTPLPFKPGSGGFGDLFRFHLFMNAGNVGNFKFDDFKEFWDEQKETARLAVGAGLALRFGQLARFELNFVFPVAFVEDDAKVKGFQVGMGINFI